MYENIPPKKCIKTFNKKKKKTEIGITNSMLLDKLFFGLQAYQVIND